MKKALIVSGITLATSITALIFLGFDPPSSFLGIVAVFILLRGLLGISLLTLIVALVISSYRSYSVLSVEEKKVVDELACPVIDLGVHHLRQRKDTWGKVANLFHRYRRYARQYQK